MSHANYPRAERVREAIKEVLASQIDRLKDPGVGFVTITDVTMSPDLRHAKAFYTVYGSDVERAATRDALQRATKFLRGAVAHEVRLRIAPTLEFAEDPVPERTQRLDEILDGIHKQPAVDREVSE
ncbi:MAG: 30S ribosome-binding factor RbfA [Actinobacteria bacterium]|nr:MAG: 30S ribosome-binding factor RbfA [Actinomycetota bacterium]